VIIFWDSSLFLSGLCRINALSAPTVEYLSKCQISGDLSPCIFNRMGTPHLVTGIKVSLNLSASLHIQNGSQVPTRRCVAHNITCTSCILLAARWHTASQAGTKLKLPYAKCKTHKGETQKRVSQYKFDLCQWTEFSCLTFQSLAVTLYMTRFNFKKFYVVPTLRLCVLYGSQNKQQLLPYKTLRDWLL
jgi:hypothetical protein